MDQCPTIFRRHLLFVKNDNKFPTKKNNNLLIFDSVLEYDGSQVSKKLFISFFPLHFFMVNDIDPSLLCYIEKRNLNKLTVSFLKERELWGYNFQWYWNSKNIAPLSPFYIFHKLFIREFFANNNHLVYMIYRRKSYHLMFCSCFKKY